MNTLLKIGAAIIAIVLLIFVITMLVGFCPPAGPWPNPPWCGTANNGATIIPNNAQVAGQNSDALASGTPKVIFNIQVPANTPAEDDVYVEIKDHPSIKLTKINTTTWSGEAMLPPNTNLYYTYNRNDVRFETMELTSSSVTEANWQNQRTVRFEPPATTVKNDVVTKWLWIDNNMPSYTVPTVGSFAPRVNGTEFQKGVGVIDYWWEVFFNNGETPKTAAQIKNDNANYVQYSPTWLVENHPDGPTLNYQCAYCYPEAAIKAETAAAKAQGLKVMFRNQVWVENELTPPAANAAAWWAKYYAARREYLTKIARIAQAENVDAISIGADYDSLVRIGLRSDAPVDSITKYVEDIAEVKKIYRGKIYYDFVTGGTASSSFTPDLAKLKPVLDQVDFIGISWWKGISDKNNPTQEELNTNAKQQFDNYLKPIYERTGKPIVLIGVAFASADGGSTGQYQYNSRATDTWKLPDNTLNDYAEQADTFNAMLFATSQSPYIIGFYPFGYWRHVQQDKGFNIRGKPAENVLKEWYASIR